MGVDRSGVAVASGLGVAAGPLVCVGRLASGGAATNSPSVTVVGGGVRGGG
eukprot:ctg_4034.g415